ncbi:MULTISPECIES: hypothetical protein [unclassified Lentimonas]|uniref:hypothetical protein n=1 Tax=unclassified Lentimonas TaxID=2630993 RepID=UPI00132C434F|nr:MULTISPECIES: hypothetical protein [unclassified Lentimonas]CAA6679700.1 Unannotated [Lentimonas sp. CC4]CAA6683534.1 Unannotated [Lentimonas sp. CC6]CAA7077295.1 Unannotated [Lentimonas sp. CC4]CAA7170190.1 Unannotated [Lentimonas sp. CC21]CAA7182422.1 Unannotated [Lentimonas sp. CC8]
MAQGKSGRIVIDVEPEFKQELYRALALKDSTLKDWFIANAQRLCEETTQPPLAFVAEEAPAYPATKK